MTLAEQIMQLLGQGGGGMAALAAPGMNPQDLLQKGPYRPPVGGMPDPESMLKKGPFVAPPGGMPPNLLQMMGGATGSWDAPATPAPAPVAEVAPAEEPVTQLEEIEVRNQRPQAGLAPRAAPAPMAPPSPVPMPPVRPEPPQAEIPIPMPRPGGPAPSAQIAGGNGAAIMAGFGGSPPTGGAAPAGGGGLGGLFGSMSGGMSQDAKDWMRNAMLGLAMGKDMNSSFANAAAMVAQGEDRSYKRGQDNKTRDAAIKMGLDPNVANGLDGRSLAQFVINQQLQQRKGVEPTDDIREFTFAKKEGFAGSFEDWQTKKRGAGDEEFGLNPIYGTNDKGEPVLYQPSKKGGVKQVEFPSGVKPSTGVEKIDVGTQWALQDRKSGQIVGYLPKDVAGEAAATVEGKQRGEAVAGLPAAENAAQTALDTVQSIRDDPARQQGTGMSSVFNAVPGTSGYGFKRKVDQAKGQSFLQAYNALRGTGSISEVEGAKAEAALQRLDVAQSEEDFNTALNDYEAIIRKGLDVQKQKAGQKPAAPAATGGAPSRSDIEAEMKRRGLPY